MFLACAVEAVEALTIVLAVGITRSWSSALYGVGAAVATLAVVVAALGPALTALPLNVLRVGVGGLLLVFGLQWLRKAILRGAGLKALHDEVAAFAHESQAALEAGGKPASGLDGYRLRSPSKGCCSRVSRSRSSSSPSAPIGTGWGSRPRPRGVAIAVVVQPVWPPTHRSPGTGEHDEVLRSV